jgi:hypothetical protein
VPLMIILKMSVCEVVFTATGELRLFEYVIDTEWIPGLGIGSCGSTGLTGG